MTTKIGVSFLISGLVASSFKSSVSMAKNNITSLSEKIKSLAQTKLDIESKLQKPGAESQALVKELETIRRKLANLRKASVIDIKLKSNIEDFKNGIAGLKNMTLAGVGTVGGFLYADTQVKQAQGKIATLGIAESGIQKITTAARKFCMEYTGVTTAEFIKASYDIKSGIASLTGKAQNALGLSFIDSKGKILPMVDILERIKEKYGEEIGTAQFKDRMASAFGGQEAGKFLNDLISKTDELSKSQKELNKAALENRLDEAMAKASERGSEFEAMAGSLRLLSEAIDNSMRPALAMLAGFITKIAGNISNFIIEHETLSKVIGSVIVSVKILIKTLEMFSLIYKGFITALLWGQRCLRLWEIIVRGIRLKIAALALTTKLSSAALWVKNTAFKAVSLTAKGTGKVFTWLSKQFTLAKIKSAAVTAGMFVQRGAMLAITVATRSAAAAQWLMNGAFLACPITWIIAGIAAVAAAAYLIVQNWDKVVAWFWDFWEIFKSMCLSGVSFIASILQTVYKLVLYPFNMISSLILSIFGKGGGPMAVFTDFWESVKSIFSLGFAFIENIAAVSEKLFSGFLGAVEAVKGWFGGDEEDNKIGIDVSKNLNVSNGAQNAAAGRSIIDKYYGSDGIVTKANTMNKGGNLAYSQNITIQGNADKEQVAAALSEGRVEFERRYNEMENRRERLSYAGGY